MVGTSNLGSWNSHWLEFRWRRSPQFLGRDLIGRGTGEQMEHSHFAPSIIQTTGLVPKTTSGFSWAPTTIEMDPSLQGRVSTCTCTAYLQYIYIQMYTPTFRYLYMHVICIRMFIYIYSKHVKYVLYIYDGYLYTLLIDFYMPRWLDATP